MINKKILFSALLTIALTVFSMGGISFSADDDSANTGHITYEDAKNANDEQWGTTGTGTRYSIVVDGEVYYVELGDTESVDGTDIKGYNSSGKNDVGNQDPNHKLGEGGTLELSREEWAALAEAYPDKFPQEVVNAIKNGDSFTCFTEQYIVVSKPPELAGKRILATEAKKLLEEHFAQGKSSLEGIGFLKNVINASFGAFFELEQLEVIEMYIALLGIDQIYELGFGIYVYEQDSPPPGSGEPSGDPSGDDEEIEDDPVEPLFELVYAGLAPDGGSPNANLSIENEEFQVASGQPIPTSERLDIVGSTELMGKVENIQKWKLVITGEAKYGVTAVWHWGYSRAISWTEYEMSGDEKVVKTNGYDEVAWPKEEKEPELPEDTEFITYYIGSINMVCYEVGAISELTIPGPGVEEYTVTYGTSVLNIAGVGVVNEVLGGSTTVPVSGPGLEVTNKGKKEGGDRSRVSYSLSYQLPGLYNNKEAAQNAVDNYAKAPQMKDYWSIETDGPVTVKGGGGSNSYSTNSAVLTTAMGVSRIGINGVGVQSIDPGSIRNRSVSDSYPTTDAYHILSDFRTMYHISPVNSVRVHTPIFNELKVESDSKNQLENTALAGDVPIVTLGDTAKITVNIKGLNGNNDSYYYADNVAKRITDLSKYVIKVELDCGLCGKTYTYTRGGSNNFTESTKNSFVHKCTVKEDRKDNTKHSVTSRVIAENCVAVSSPATRNDGGKYNTPDNQYIIEQKSGVYVAGKMYDLEVRATDDPGWKDFVGKQAQKLNTLPVGEKSDNGLAAYKYGIKLGYRAFFDLKTLGVATNNVKITPKIYYIKPDGTATTDVDLYYRTGPTTYKQLMDNGVIVDTNDITIKMSLNTTKGDKYNTVFNDEKLQTMKQMNTAIKFAQMDYIGGLSKITLDSEGATANALMTKYNNAYQTKVYSMQSGTLTEETNYTNSRRWYGEIYLPASTIVADKNAKIEEVARGIKTYKTGYLLVAFDSIETTTDGTTQYLKYSTAHDPKGNDDPPYILRNEKNNKGRNDKPIVLPNGKGITTIDGKLKGITDFDFYTNSAPIIIYDVSLRANNDYEGGGTH